MVRAAGENDVETFARGRAPMRQRLHECLRHVVGMHVMERFHAEVRQCQRLPACQRLKHVEVDVAGGIDGCPTRTDDVPRMQHGGRQTATPRFVEEVSLDGRLVDAVVVNGPARLLFGDRHFRAGAVNPDRAAMQKVLYLSPLPESLDQLAGAFRCEANQIDDRLWIEPEDLRSEAAACFLGLPIEDDGAHELPAAISLIRLTLLPADHGHFVPAGHETRHKKRPDVPRTTYDDNSHDGRNLMTLRCGRHSRVVAIRCGPAVRR